MSEPLRVALVAEGPTDRTVIQAALRAALPARPFVLQQLQPEGSLAFGPLGAGWTGVYRWCRQAAKRGAGRLGSDFLLFQNYDLLILHLDADVAGMEYGHGSIVPAAGDGPLPCERPCPPVRDTTDLLRAVLLSWCGEMAVPPRTVICMPSKSTEAWVVAALFPDDRAVRIAIECLANPGIAPGPATQGSPDPQEPTRLPEQREAAGAGLAPPCGQLGPPDCEPEGAAAEGRSLNACCKLGATRAGWARRRRGSA